MPDVHPRPTAIVAALPEELGALRGRIERTRGAPKETTLVPGVDVLLGRLRGQEVVLAVLGEGAKRAADALERLLTALEPARLFVVGIAGAISDGLDTGDLVISREVRAVSLGPTSDDLGQAGGYDLPGPVGATASHAPDPDLFAHARRVLGGLGLSDRPTPAARSGLVVSAPELVLEPAQKRELHLLTGSARPAVVDLESAPLTEVADRHHVPWLVLRAVSDTAGERLPALLARCRDEQGGTDRLQLVRAALTHPDVWRTLFLLRRRVLASARVIADAVEEVLAT